MITIHRPGRQPLNIEYILIDFEGTLASDGRVHPKAKDKINLLSKRTKLYIFANGEKTAVEERLRKVNAEIIYLADSEASRKKLDLLLQLGPASTVAIGNGADDAAMIGEAGLGICVLGKEAAAAETLGKADLVVTNILDALDFLLKPLRQEATLRL
jgi:soluble P-type ATPase